MPILSRIFSSLLAVGAVAAPVALAFDRPAATYRFTVENADFGSLHAAKNCLDYSHCGTHSTSLVELKGGYRLHTDAQMTRSELRAVMSACAGTFRGVRGLSVSNLDTGEKVRIEAPPASSTPPGGFSVLKSILKAMGSGGARERPRLDLRPVRLQPIRGGDSALDRIRALSDRDDFTGSIHEAVRSFGHDVHGYAIAHDPSLDPTHAAAVIEVGEKKIRFSTDAFRATPCWTVVYLRHELEHARQHAQNAVCKALKRPSPFEDHVDRERAAYMNDVSNARVICPADQAERVREDRRDYFLKTYLRH